MVSMSIIIIMIMFIIIIIISSSSSSSSRGTLKWQYSGIMLSPRQNTKPYIWDIVVCRWGGEQP